MWLQPNAYAYPWPVQEQRAERIQRLYEEDRARKAEAPKGHEVKRKCRCGRYIGQQRLNGSRYQHPCLLYSLLAIHALVLAVPNPLGHIDDFSTSLSIHISRIGRGTANVKNFDACWHAHSVVAIPMLLVANAQERRHEQPPRRRRQREDRPWLRAWSKHISSHFILWRQVFYFVTSNLLLVLSHCEDDLGPVREAKRPAGHYVNGISAATSGIVTMTTGADIL